MNAESAATETAYRRARQALVDRLRAEGISDGRVLMAIGQTPRHHFVDEALAHRAYEDTALPIGFSQTISQPYIVARMTQAVLADGPPPARVLEIGTGCGYQSVVLAQLVERLFTVERIEALQDRARQQVKALGLTNVRYKLADGHFGWKEQGPYDAIIVTAAPTTVPQALIEQLRVGGRLVVPVGEGDAQELRLVTRMQQGIRQQLLSYVRFVPLIEGDLDRSSAST